MLFKSKMYTLTLKRQLSYIQDQKWCKYNDIMNLTSHLSINKFKALY